MHEFLKLGEILWKLAYFGPFLLLIILLNAADYYTTKKILKAGGVELNPVVKWIIDKKLFGIFKSLFTIFIVVIIWHYCTYNRHTTIMLIASVVICIFYIVVVINNVRQLCILKRNLK